MVTLSTNIAAEYNPLDPGFTRNLYRFYARMREEAPVLHAPQYGLWLVSRHHDIVSVLRDPVRFSSAAAMEPAAPLPPEVQAIVDQTYARSHGLVAADPPLHTRVRALAGQAFGPRQIARMEPRIRALTHELIDEFVHLGRADALPQLAFPLPMRVILDLIGIPGDDVTRIKSLHDDWTATFYSVGLPLEEQVASAHRTVLYLRYLADLVEDRRNAPRDDLTSVLVHANTPAAEPLTTGELVWLLAFLVSAGHVTTTNVIATSLLHVLLRPGCWPSLLGAPALLPSAIGEAIRLDPSFLLVRRTTTQQVELAGVQIPQGASIGLLVASGNRDPAAFVAPDDFDIERSCPKPSLTFGHGIHYCIGAMLGRLQARIALEVLGERLPNLRLPEGFVPEWQPHFFIRTLTGLPVHWDVG